MSVAPAAGRTVMLASPRLYVLVIFVSAFLLFQVEPMAGKIVLPWFGGGSTVWITTLMFFQVTLLLGYAYAHFVALRLSPRAQGAVHIVLLAVVLALVATVHVIPPEALRPSGTGNPAWHLVLVLGATVGPPFLLLSTTGPLVQHWFASRFPGRSPYPLYALSNVGSLLALLTYPVAFERFLGLHAQAWIWSLGYATFALACGAVAWQARGLRAVSAGEGQALESEFDALPAEPEMRIDLARVLLWAALPAVASALLLAVTNQLIVDVAAVPLLWVLPLAVYLLTFIACFSSDRMYESNLYTLMLIPACYGGVYALRDMPIVLHISLYLLVLFLVCMSLHGETARLRPGPARLTAFYLMVSVGGALGGLFVALAAPVLFRGYWEYHVALFAAPVFVLLSRLYEERLRIAAGSARGGRAWYLLAGGAMVGIGLLALLGVSLRRNTQTLTRGVIAFERNFYGVVRIYRAGSPLRVEMQHGRILHGFQYLDEPLRSAHTGYYGPATAAGLALTQAPQRAAGPLRVGIIGLGAGMIATYAQPGDNWTFYEINPMVTQIAERDFSYLDDARKRGAQVAVTHGDARTVLEREYARDGSRQFDVLILDAFTSDAIPVHLLTRESVATYWKQLKPDGVLVVHISNAYVDLAPVVRGFAADSGHEAHWTTGSGAPVGAEQSFWVAVTNNRGFLDDPVVAKALAPWPEGGRAPVLWTDDYTNLYSLLRLR